MRECLPHLPPNTVAPSSKEATKHPYFGLEVGRTLHASCSGSGPKRAPLRVRRRGHSRPVGCAHQIFRSSTALCTGDHQQRTAYVIRHCNLAAGFWPKLHKPQKLVRLCGPQLYTYYYRNEHKHIFYERLNFETYGFLKAIEQHFQITYISFCLEH